jgi:hypothetical protein
LDQTLFGMIDARKLAALLQDPQFGLDFAGFAALINRGYDQARLAELPGFVPADADVTRQSDKRKVLEKMEERGAEWLPVQTPEHRFEALVHKWVSAAG